MIPIGLVYSIYDSTEVAIQKMMIDASQRMLKVNSQGGELGGGMNPPIKKHLELEIKTLQNAPRCRQIGTAFASKTKTKRRSNGH
jgi:hypothetical protein